MGILCLSTAGMGHLATLFWLFTSTRIATTNSGNECCQRKCWGADIYNFIHTSSDTSKVNCDSNCVYEKENEPQSRYCFKAGGDQISVCSSMRERQNLTDLMQNNPEDYKALINALREAKKPGTYNGPPIKGVSDENPINYDSSYNAATSFLQHHHHPLHHVIITVGFRTQEIVTVILTMIFVAKYIKI